MKKLKVIFINILFILLAFFILDVIAYFMLMTENKDIYTNIYKNANYLKFYLSAFNIIKADFDNPINTISRIRVAVQKDEDFVYIRKQDKHKDFFSKNSIANSPILIFGCSFAHGSLLKPEQTLSYKLAKETHRNIYNFALPGGGLQHMLYILDSELVFHTLESDNAPEYAFFIYIPNHLLRLDKLVFDIMQMDLNYTLELRESNLVENPLYQNIFIRKILSTFIAKKLLIKEQPSTVELKYKRFALLNEILLQSRERLKKQYKNIKFCIIRYRIEDDKDGDEALEFPYMWEILEKEGFTIVDTSKLIGRKYKNNSEDTTMDKAHPSEKAWDLLLQPLIDYLHL